MSTSPAGPPRSYSIPTVDLAHKAARQVTVDRERNLYLGHPRTVLLDDDRTMLVVYSKGHGRGAIVMKRSRDGGLTWSKRLPVAQLNYVSEQKITLVAQEPLLAPQAAPIADQVPIAADDTMAGHN